MARGNGPGLGDLGRPCSVECGKEGGMGEGEGGEVGEREREMIMRVGAGRKGEREGGWGGGREGLNVGTSLGFGP